MNSCVAFSCMFYHTDSSVSGTSVSSPAAAVAGCYRCANNFFSPTRCLLRTQHHPLLIPGISRPLCGLVLCAAVLCIWSSALPLLRSGSALLLRFMSSEVQQPSRCRLCNASASGRSLCASAIPWIESAIFTSVSAVSSAPPPGSSRGPVASADTHPRRKENLPTPALNLRSDRGRFKTHSCFMPN